jgi:cell division protein FtsX
MLKFTLALKSIRSSFMSSLALVLISSLLLTIAGTGLMMLRVVQYSSGELLKSQFVTLYLKNSPTVSVSDNERLDGIVSGTANPIFIHATQRKDFENRLLKIKGVSDIRFVSKNDFVSAVAKLAPGLSQDIAELDQGIIPNYVRLRVSKPSSVTELQKLSEVESVVVSETKGLKQSLALTSKFEMGLMGLLAVLVLLVVFAFMYGASTANRFQIQIQRSLKSMGAQSKILLKIYIYQGLVLGCCAGLLSGTLLIISHYVFVKRGVLEVAEAFEVNSTIIVGALEVLNQEVSLIALSVFIIASFCGLLGTVVASLKNTYGTAL